MDDKFLITTLYRQLLGREPDEAGLTHFLGVLENSGDMRTVMTALLRSDEYRLRHGGETPKLEFRLSRPVCVVDVGAQKLSSEEHLYAPLLRAGLQCRCIGFEPLGEGRVELEGSGAEFVYYPQFIGDGSMQTFHLANDDATSSLLPFDASYCSQFNHLETLHTVSREPVKTACLDDVLASEVAVDLLKLDIQGFELAALRGATELLKRTGVVHCEVGFAPIYAGQPYFSEIELALREAGFHFVDFTAMGRYAYTQAPMPTGRAERLNWADAVFFKDIPEEDANGVSGQAAIAAHVYGKFGLAQTLLQGQGPNGREWRQK